MHTRCIKRRHTATQSPEYATSHLLHQNPVTLSFPFFLTNPSLSYIYPHPVNLISLSPFLFSLSLALIRSVRFFPSAKFSSRPTKPRPSKLGFLPGNVIQRAARRANINGGEDIRRRYRVCPGAEEAEQLHPRLIGESSEIARDRTRARRLGQAPRGSGPLRLRPPQALRRRLETPTSRIPVSLPKCGYPRRARSDRTPPQPNLDAAGRVGTPNPGPNRDLWDPEADCDIRQGHANGPPGRGESQVSGDCEAACGRRQC